MLRLSSSWEAACSLGHIWSLTQHRGPVWPWAPTGIWGGGGGGWEWGLLPPEQRQVWSCSAIRLCRHQKEKGLVQDPTLLGEDPGLEIDYQNQRGP